MYKCGKEEAPVVFGKMVVWQEVTSEEVNSDVANLKLYSLKITSENSTC
jgi:hypothetical protein